MMLTKYRMIVGEGYVETLDLLEAEAHGDYIIVTEEITDINQETIEN